MVRMLSSGSLLSPGSLIVAKPVQLLAHESLAIVGASSRLIGYQLSHGAVSVKYLIGLQMSCGFSCFMKDPKLSHGPSLSLRNQ